MKEYKVDIETDERIYSEIVKSENKTKALRRALNKVSLQEKDSVIRAEVIWIR